MMHTIAQIGLVVFALDTGAQAAEIRDVREYWLANHPSVPKASLRQQRSLANFDSWVRSKGDLVQRVFSKSLSPAHLTRENKNYFVRILDAMLSLQRVRLV